MDNNENDYTTKNNILSLLPSISKKNDCFSSIPPT